MKEDIKKGIEFIKEKKDEYLEDRENELLILKQNCIEEVSTLRKLYMIRDSKIMPYSACATSILQDKVVPISLKKESINKLAKADLISSSDFDELMLKLNSDIQMKIIKKESVNNDKNIFSNINTKGKRIREAKKAGLAYCPKCGSTSITTTNKKFSATRMLTLGIAGAVSSKKMYNVCQRCGHRWKI